MATTDSNGLIYYGTTDPVEPLQALLNGISSSVSSALDATSRIFRTPNEAGRNALLISKGSSPSNPLFVYREDTQFIEKHNGSYWRFVDRSVPWTGLTAVDSNWNLGARYGYGGLSANIDGNIVTIQGALRRTGNIIDGYRGAILPANVPPPGARIPLNATRGGTDIPTEVSLGTSSGTFLNQVCFAGTTSVAVGGVTDVVISGSYVVS